MKSLSVTALLFVILVSCSSPKEEIEMPVVSIAQAEARLNKLASMMYDYEQADEIHQYLDSLKRARMHPVTEDTTVLFVHFGAAESVEWRGSFNSWGNDTTENWKGNQIGQSKIWLLKKNFASDTRVDYKIVVNGDRWIEDPYNINRQLGGSGYNSELRMPDFKEDPITQFRLGIDRGKLGENILISSEHTESDHHYRVYLPHNYEKLDQLPVIYVTDGQDYSHNGMGNMVTIMDNLIADGAIEPLVAVFVDPREPSDNQNNRRGIYLPMNEDYLNFFTEELIPEVESNFKISNEATSRGMLGTSLGGINSTYFCFERPDVFGNCAIQSPAYWFRRQIYDVVENSEAKPEQLQIAMTTGTINDDEEMTLMMKELMESKGFEVNLITVNQGHSWGAWTDQLDDMLIQFYGK
jgi:enterochelin esterase family protein